MPTTIIVSVPSMLRAEVDGMAELRLSVGTVSSALERLEAEYPKLHRRICDETGTLRPHVNLFVNNAFLQECNGLDTVLCAGDVLSIMPAISGG